MFGYLFSAFALGAMLGTLSVSTIGKHRSVGESVAGGCLLMGISLVTFSFRVSFHHGLVLMFLTGCGMMFAYPTLSAAIQKIGNEQKMLGRMAAWNRAMLFGGLMIGGWLNGEIAERIGSLRTIRIDGVASLLLVGVAVILLRKRTA
jgi:predicted MFS family arabinose efflux permease